MYIVAIGWLYVAVMMAAAEAGSTNGTVLGAVFTFLLYGVLPLTIVMYVLRTPARRRARLAAEALAPSTQEPDGGDHAAGDAVAPEREKS
jgi:hypothetical protein